MTATVDQGLLVLAQISDPQLRVDQGHIIAAVSFTPPNSPPQVDQGVLIAAVRQVPVFRYLEINPATDLPCIASCGSVPYFWRET